MTKTQRFFAAIMPEKWAESMEQESRQWKRRCSCGQEKSIWELGGIRWKAKGNKKRYADCSACGKTSWMTVFRGGVDQ